jgi:hypothetical protein
MKQDDPKSMTLTSHLEYDLMSTFSGFKSHCKFGDGTGLSGRRQRVHDMGTPAYMYEASRMDKGEGLQHLPRDPLDARDGEVRRFACNATTGRGFSLRRTIAPAMN